VVLPGHIDFARLPQQAFVQLLGLGLGLLWAAGQGGTRAPGGRRAFDAPLGVFLAWSALSLLDAREAAPGLRLLGHWAACGAVYLLVSRAAGPGDVPRLAGGLLLGGAVASALGLGQALLGLDWVPQAAAPAATLANRNVAAAYAAALAPLALLPWPGRRARVAAALAAGTMLAFLPFARSRAALVAVAVQLALLALAFRRPRVPARPGGRLVPAVAIASALALASAAAWLSLADSQKAESTSIRWSLARSAVSMAAERPLLGVGLGGFAAHYTSHGPALASPEGIPFRVDSPHDEPLQVLAETGGPGLAAALWIALATVAVARRLLASPDPFLRRAATALGLGLAGLAVDASFGFPLRYPLPPLVLAVLLGLLAALDPAASPAPVAGGHRAPGAARLVRLGAAAALVAAPALALLASAARLRQDRAAFEAALLPVAHAQSQAAASCGAGVTLDRAADGRLELSARAVPLADLLQCLAERTGLRVEYDGPAPRQAVSVALRGEPLDRTLGSLLEGLGINYLLTRDASGLDRLIVFGSAGAVEPARGGGTRAPAGAGRPEPAALPEPEVEEEEPPPSFPAPPQPFPPPAAPAGSEPPGAVVPFEEPPLAPEPQELTPLTLQLGRRPGPVIASTTGNSPVR
jgi:hypothetical protein